MDESPFFYYNYYMGTIYGTSLTEQKLTAQEIGYNLAPKKQQESWIQILRWIITGIEIGFAFVPGVGVLGETAIGLIGGGLNEYLDYRANNLNVQNSFFNFGVPLIAGGATALANARGVARTVESAETLASMATTGGVRNPTFVRNLIDAGIINGEADLANIERLASIVRSTPLSAFKSANLGYDAFLNASRSLPNYTRSSIRLQLRQMHGVVNKFKNVAVETGQALKIQRSLLSKIGLETGEINDILKVINHSNLSQEQRFSAVVGYLREVEVLKNSRTNRIFLEAFQKGEIALNEAYQIPLARRLTSLTANSTRATAISAETVKAEGRTVFNRMWRALKNPASKDFDKLFVQKIQAMFDANDFGRAPWEASYQVIKRQIQRWIPALKKIEKVEEAFTQAGGVTVDSGWHLGYRKVTTNPGVPNLTQISYYMNSGAVRNVFVWATDAQLNAYASDPGHYYLTHWAYSKGGKRLSIQGMFGHSFGKQQIQAIESALTFIPTGALRHILSITSNIVENVYDMSKGVWTKQYKDKWLNSTVKTIVGRTIRLGIRDVTGGLIGRKFGVKAGQILGRELQRIGTNIIQPLFTKAWTEMQTTSKGKHRQYEIHWGNQILKTVVGGVSSNLRSALRRHRGTSSVILNSLTLKRQMQQVGRIPNAILPKRPYRGIRLQKRKTK